MKEVLKKFGEVLEDVNLKKYNTYHIVSSCKYMIFPTDVKMLVKLLNYLNQVKIKYLILGNGSNVILCDNFFNGVFIKLDKLNNLIIKDNLVKVEAGYFLPKLAIETANNNLKGLEWASGIPGFVGGSIIGNAGAYKECMFDYVKDVTIIDENFDIKTLLKEEIEYGYRTTSLKNNNVIVVAVTLKLTKGNKAESIKLIQNRKEKRLASQPLEYPSAGSVFRNPENDFAGRLIEEIGFKNKFVGGAYISDKHANFIINKNKATGEDICNLINLIKEIILEKHCINLVLEQEVIKW